MKILHITPAYKPAFIYGGPTMSVAALCENLMMAGHQVEVFTTTANGNAELRVNEDQPVIIDGVTTRYFKRITKDHTHFSPALLKALRIRAIEFDVIHIHSWWNLVALLSCMIALHKNKKVLVSPRGMLSGYSFAKNHVNSKSLIHRLLGKRLLNNCHLHVTSANEQHDVVQLINPLNSTILPNFVTLGRDGSYGAKTFNDNPVKLLFLSRIEEKKGLDILFNALKGIAVPFHLTIAGDGEPAYLDQLKTIAVNNKIDSFITWAGFYGDDKFDLLHQHDLLVLPSHNENFGNVVIESLSVGTAVVISDGVGLSDYVLNYRFGWACKAEPAIFRETITNIWQNHQGDLIRIAQTAPAVVQNDFTGEGLSARYTQLYRQVYQS